MDTGQFAPRIFSKLGTKLRSHGHWILLTLLMGILFITRAVGYRKYVTEDGVLLRGSEPWYHFREIAYTVDHFPWTLPIDPFTGYPEGVSAGEYGTVFDQLSAALALIVGGGAPTDQTILFVLLFVPPLLATLVAIPVYHLGTRIAGGCRWTGVTAVGLLTVFSGVFFEQGVVGAADHHIAEALMLACTTVSFLFALSAARTELPVYEAVRDTPSSAQTSIRWSVLTGVFVALFMGVWPSSVVFIIAIFALFVSLYAVLSVYSGETAEPVLVVTAISMVIAGVVAILQLDTFGVELARISLTQVLIPWGIALGCAYLAVLSRVIETRDLQASMFLTGSVLPLIVGGCVVYLLAPEVFEMFRVGFIRVFGLGVHADTLKTVSGAQPITYHGGVAYLFDQYGAVIGVAVLGFLALVYRGVRRRSSEALFLTIWVAALAVAAMTQVQFNHFFAIAVAALAAYAFRIIVNQLDLPHTMVPHEFVSRLRGYQVLAILFIIMTVLPMLLFPLSGTVFGAMGSHEPTEYQRWDSSLDWLSENTPPMGELEGATNPVDFSGPYAQSKSFEYPPGSYGVMSWIRYGHWITTGGERAAVSNSFPTHAEEASEYLLATDEETAQQVMAEMDSEAQARYVMVDWKMVSPDSQFLRPVAYHPNRSVEEYTTPLYLGRNEQLEYVTNVRSQAYYESLMVRLYQYHGSAVDPKPIVVDYEMTSPSETSEERAIVPTTRRLVEYKGSVAAAREAAAGDSTAQVGGIGIYPQERVNALNHYRLVYASNSSATDSTKYSQMAQKTALLTGMSSDLLTPKHPAWVKTFERVPGATVEGTAPANSTIRAMVDVQMPNQNTTFTYTAYADADRTGSFELTVPYSTTGVDNWGPKDGYTDTSVVGTGPYRFETAVEEQSDSTGNWTLTHWSAEAHVTEAQVIGEDTSPVQVDLKKQNTVSNSEGEPSTESDPTNVPENESG